MNSTRLLPQTIHQTGARRLFTTPSNFNRTTHRSRSFATNQSPYIKRNPFEQEMIRRQSSKPSAFASFNRFLITNLFRHTSIFTAVVLFSAIGFGVEYDALFNYLWKEHNKGKLFEETILVNFAGTPPNCEEEEEEEEEAEEEPSEE